ncbi:PH domain-containing protein [Nocardioides sp. BGMRC 2183]|nr:PH domain-containing protein [Nocardioides sp. BGMRC 2183]
MWSLSSAISCLLVVVGVGLATTLWLEGWWTWPAIALTVALAVANTLLVPQWRYLVHRWEATDTAVYTQRGWWSRERRIAPMSRVQTVDFTQGPLARLLGLATVTVTTASAAGPLQIDGLETDVALGLVDDLTRKADLVEGDAT